MPINIDCHGESHVGRKRPDNEDQFLIADLNKSMRVHQTSLGLSHQTRLFGGSQGKLLLVADGLGGHESGERASTLAVDGVANYILNAMDWFFRLTDQNESDFESELKEVFHHSQGLLEAEAEAIPQRRGMATTLTMAYIDWPKLYVVHVGDTRCYHIRGNQIVCLTTDHTLGQLASVAETQDDQKMNDDTRPMNPMSNALWNVIGGNDTSLDPQITKTDLQAGDCLLLCSDGLTHYVSDEEIEQMVNQEDCSAKETCERFIEVANERGGRDNITTVLAKFNEQQVDDDCEHAVVEQSSSLQSVAIN